MAYAQWAATKITTYHFTARVKNASHSYGKFYCGSKDNEVSKSAINGVVVAPGDPFTIWACGRSNEAAGTQGSFDIYDGGTHVGTYTWDCPWGSPTNRMYWYPSNDSYLCQFSGGSLSGAIGTVTLKIVKFG